MSTKFVLFLCVTLWLKTKIIYATHSLLTRFSTAPPTPFHNKKIQDGVEGKEISDITMIQAELLVTFAKFQTVHFMKCFDQWCSHWTCSIKSQCDYYDGNNCSQSKGWFYRAVNSVQKLCDCTMCMTYPQKLNYSAPVLYVHFIFCMPKYKSINSSFYLKHR